MSDQTETAELVVEEHTYSPAPRYGAVEGPITLFGSEDPVAVIERATHTATALAEIIKTRELYKHIGDRDHVLVEGWTLLGSMLGVFPVTVWCRPIEGFTEPRTELRKTVKHSKWCRKGPSGHKQHADCETYEKEGLVTLAPGKGGWEARVEARTRTGDIIGAAEAECRWSESAWWDRESYALRSMAQTRATSKALRMPLGFIVELAGFSATPAEEIPDAPPHSDDDTTSTPAGPRGVHDSHRCPGCDAPVYDNRDAIAAGDRPENFPVWKCSNRDCTAGKDGLPWASWSPHEFLSPTAKAKIALVKVIAKHEAGWRIYYPEDDPSYGDEQRALVAGAHESKDHAQMAGILWNDLAPHVFEVADSPTLTELEVIVEAGELALARAANDANDIASPEEVVENAAEIVDERIKDQNDMGYS